MSIYKSQYFIYMEGMVSDLTMQFHDKQAVLLLAFDGWPMATWFDLKDI